MKNLLLIIAFLVLAAAVKVDESQVKFRSFMRTYNRRYTGDEFRHRFAVFKDNLRRIDQLNREHAAEGYSGHFDINEFTDLSPAEFASRRMGYQPVKVVASEDAETAIDDGSIITGPLPTSWDWRTKGAVTPVKNQGECGSCWAFSTTEGVESGYFLAGNTLPVLAPQQIVDCSTANDGCGGGNLPPALNYVMANGMEAETSYPYTGSNGNCKYSKSKVVATLKSWKYATRTANETAMQVFSYARGPLSICVDAASWQNYNSGVIKHKCGTSLDHCVQIVGWGVATPSPTSSTGSSDSSSSGSPSSSPTGTPSPPTTTTKLDANPISYWIVRNSWGTSWGLKGYLWVERGNNECGIAQEAIYPEA